jgi:TonB family protein
MQTAMALRRDDVWTRRVVRMVGLSTVAHVGIFAALALLAAWVAAHRPEPIIAYSVELTDFPGTGGRLPGGPGNNLIGRSPALPAAKPSAAPPASPAPKAAEPVAAKPPPAAMAPVAPKPVAPKPVAPKPVAPTPAEVAPKPVVKAEVKKVEPKPEAKKVEAKKVETAKTPSTPAEAAKPAAKAAVEPPAAKTPPPPAVAAPAPDAKAAASSGAPPSGTKAAKPSDDYASAAQRFRDRMAAVGTGAGVPGEGVAGGGPGGGVLGAGGDGRGGGQVKSLEWVAYRQRILNAVKERWSNAIKRPGLLTTVRFRIARDGTISRVEVSKASGNAVYDQTAVAAVERVRQLPPPPPAYADEFAEFEVNFYGEETGGVS